MGGHFWVASIEANISPVDGATHGTLVFDGSIPSLRLGGVLRSPVICTVEQGNIVKVEGGHEADLIRRVWAGMNRPTLRLDGRGILENGQLTVDLA